MRENGKQQAADSSLLSSWKKREVAMWYQSLRSSVMVAMLVSSPVRVAGHLMSAYESYDYVFIAIAVFGCSLSLLVFLRPAATPSGQKLQMSLLLNTIQLYFLYLGCVLYRQSTVIWGVASSIIFGVYEIPSFQEKWVNFIMLIRQFGMWYMVVRLQCGEQCHFPYLLCGLAAWVVYVLSVQIRHRWEEYYGFCQSLEEEKAKLNSVLQANPEGLLVITATGDFHCFNSRLQMILKTENPRESLRCLHCLQTLDSSDTSSFSLDYQVTSFLAESNQLSIEVFGVTLISGQYYEWKGTKCTWGTSTACILSVSDISNWVADQRSLKQESAAKTAMLRFVSHELRTPANAIVNLVQKVMRAANLDDEQRSELQIVMTSTQLLLSVVNDLLDFTRILANKFTLSKHSFDLRKTVREAASLVENQCNRKGLWLIVKIDDFIPDFVYSDENRLKQVLVNLLENAVRFTFRGGIRVVCLITERNTVRVTVQDTGVGIAKEKIVTMKQSFSSARLLHPQTCGLGLYISNLLALSLGPVPLSVQSAAGVGSEFSIEMAISPHDHFSNTVSTLSTNEPEVGNERDSEQPVLYSNVSGGKTMDPLHSSPVLIVDDIEFNRVVLQMMLTSFGVRADEASSGLRALRRIRDAARRGHFYRLILMDVEMPELDGIEATRAIRALELSGELPQRPQVVACTAHHSQEDVDRCLEAGMDSYLEKPVCKPLLQELVEANR